MLCSNSPGFFIKRFADSSCLSNKKKAGRNQSSRLLHSPHIYRKCKRIKPALHACRILLPAFYPLTLPTFPQAFTPPCYLSSAEHSLRSQFTGYPRPHSASACGRRPSPCRHISSRPPRRHSTAILCTLQPTRTDTENGLFLSNFLDCATGDSLPFCSPSLSSPDQTIPCFHDERMNEEGGI
jgi:hypothetical protein